MRWRRKNFFWWVVNLPANTPVAQLATSTGGGSLCLLFIFSFSPCRTRAKRQVSPPTSLLRINAFKTRKARVYTTRCAGAVKRRKINARCYATTDARAVRYESGAIVGASRRGAARASGRPPVPMPRGDRSSGRRAQQRRKPSRHRPTLVADKLCARSHHATFTAPAGRLVPFVAARARSKVI